MLHSFRFLTASLALVCVTLQHLGGSFSSSCSLFSPLGLCATIPHCSQDGAGFRCRLLFSLKHVSLISLINISLIPCRRWNFKAAASASLVARFLISYFIQLFGFFFHTLFCVLCLAFHFISFRPPD